MLILDIEEKMKDCEHVTIKGVRFMDDGEIMTDIDGNDLSVDEYDHIFADEFFEDLDDLKQKSIEEFRKMIPGKKTFWVSLSNSYNKPTVDQIGVKIGDDGKGPSIYYVSILLDFFWPTNNCHYFNPNQTFCCCMYLNINGSVEK